MKDLLFSVLKVIRTITAFGVFCALMLPSELGVSSLTEDEVSITEKAQMNAGGDSYKKSEGGDSKPEVRMSYGYTELPEGSQQPWKLLRGLQRAQDDIVAGSSRAEDAYKLLLVNLSKVMSALDDEVWNHERNIDALATFIILGGNTELGYKALQKTKLSNIQTQPLSAAIAYSERDLRRAYKLMNQFDHAALPPSMSAHFALARSMVVGSTDIELAQQLLNQARKLAPGTLVEEAALRRLLRIAGEKRDFEETVFLSRTYMSRFSDSFYFRDFLTNFSFGLVRMAREREGEALKLLKATLVQADDSEKVAVALYVARHSTISGKKKMAQWAGELGLDLLSKGSVDHARFQLYVSATDITKKGKTVSALEKLTSLKSADFTSKDKRLLSSAIQLGTHILQSPSGSFDKSSLADPKETSMNKTGKNGGGMETAEENNPTLKRAMEILSQSDSILENVL